LTGYNFLNWYLTLRSFHYSLYVRCILSWGRALGPLGGLSTGQLNCCLSRMEEKRERGPRCFILYLLWERTFSNDQIILQRKIHKHYLVREQTFSIDQKFSKQKSTNSFIHIPQAMSLLLSSVVDCNRILSSPFSRSSASLVGA